MPAPTRQAIAGACAVLLAAPIPAPATAFAARIAAARTATGPATGPDSDPEATPDPGRGDGSEADHAAGGDAPACDDAPDPAACRRAHEAAEAFAAGRAAFEAGRYLDAARAFERSYAQIAAPETLFNIGVSYAEAGEAVHAAEAFDRYLQTAEADATHRDEARRALADLRGRVGRIVLEGDPPPRVRAVRVEGRALHPDEPIYVAPGTVTLEVVAGDGRRRVRTYDVMPGQTLVLAGGALLPPPPPKPPRPPPADPRAPAGRDIALRRTTWGLFGATLTGAAAMTVTGTLALVEARRFNDGKCSMVCTPEELADKPAFPEEHRRRAKALATATNVLVGLVSALAVATVAVGIAARRRRARPRRGARPRRAVDAVPHGPSR